MARRPQIFKWIMDIPSGQMAEDDLARWIAFTVSSSEMDLLFPNFPQVIVIADASILFVETLCNCSTLSVDLALESDGLIRRTKHSLARETADKIRKLCRIRRIVGRPQFLIELLSLVAVIPNLTIQNRNLRVTRVRNAQAVVNSTSWLTRMATPPPPPPRRLRRSRA